MMKFSLLAAVCLSLVLAFLGNGQEASKFDTRCGWFSNPTPANIWLQDRDAQWIIGTQADINSKEIGRGRSSKKVNGYGPTLGSMVMDARVLYFALIKTPKKCWRSRARAHGYCPLVVGIAG